MCGISVWHVRILCDNTWEGGRGYTPDQVSKMTLDNVLMLLTDRKILKAKEGRRGKKIMPLAASVMAGKDGMIKGRAADGSEIRGKITGKSKARQLMEAEEKKKKRRKRR